MSGVPKHAFLHASTVAIWLFFLSCWVHQEQLCNSTTLKKVCKCLAHFSKR